MSAPKPSTGNLLLGNVVQNIFRCLAEKDSPRVPHRYPGINNVPPVSYNEVEVVCESSSLMLRRVHRPFERTAILRALNAEYTDDLFREVRDHDPGASACSPPADTLTNRLSLHRSLSTSRMRVSDGAL